MLVGVDMASPVAENLDLLWVGKKLLIWLCWEQADSSGSGFAGRREAGLAGFSGFGFAGSKLVVVEMASLVAVNLDSLWAGKQRWIWFCSHNSDMLGLTTLTCSLIPLWQSGYAGSKLVAVDLTSLVQVKLASPVARDLSSQVRQELASQVIVNLDLLKWSWYDVASNRAVDLALHLAVDLTLQRVDRGILHSAEGGIIDV